MYVAPDGISLIINNLNSYLIILTVVIFNSFTVHIKKKKNDIVKKIMLEKQFNDI